MATRVRPDYRHFVERVQRQSPQPLTKRDLEIIEHRQVQVLQSVRPVLSDPYFQSIADPHSIATKGGIAYQRQLAFAKVAIFNEGRVLLAHWPTIKYEMRIPWSLHYYNASEPAWRAVGSMLESTFYSTKTDAFDSVELGLYDGRWLPVEETAVPGFGIVETDDALEFLGLIGGVDPLIAHPSQVFKVRPAHTTLTPETVVEAQLRANVYAEFPVVYTTSNAPSWIILTTDGLVRYTPPAMSDTDIVLEVTAVDGLGVEVAFTINIAVRN